MNESSFCSTSSSAFGVVSVLDFDHSNRSEVVSHCVLIFISLMTYNVEHLFTWLFAIYISSFVNYLLMYLACFKIGLFVFLLLNFKSSLYVLYNSPLSDVSFENIFSQSVACLFILFTVSFAEQKNLILTKSNLSSTAFEQIEGAALTISNLNSRI